MKKIAAMLACVMTVGLLGGCGNSFDASAYLKAVLDNSYKNDSTGFVELEVGTAEESAEVYQEGLTEIVDSYLYGLDATDEQKAAFEETFAEILAGAKYTVGEAEKQDDGSYVVTVTYEQMNLYVPAIAIYEEDTEALMTEWTEAAAAGEEVPSNEEMMTQLVDLLKVSLDEAYANVTYNEAATTTVKVEIVDEYWTPSAADLETLGGLLFDADAASQALAE
ncbi:MAG: hypothetical protein J6B68_00225 [Lachnospiraceae bacterium]|jgi:hypothetical protein|nr:hypothetical protein [Lachnospiraceae bacterium]